MTALPDLTGGASPIGSARDTAISGAIAGTLAFLSGRLRWPSLALAVLFGLWATSEFISVWAASGQFSARPLWLGLTGAGLALGSSIAVPLLSGWSIFLIGCIYVYANLFVLWRNYMSLGQQFPGAAVWLSSGGWIPTTAERPASAPELSSGADAVLQLATHDIATYNFGGLGVNSNLTGNFAAFFVVFMAPFAISRWQPWATTRPVAMAGSRVALLCASAVPGVLLLAALDARTALIGVLLGWSVLALPLGWSRNWRAATVAAALAPLVMLLPPLAAHWELLSANGRDCVWGSWWPAISGSPLLGVGPGGFPGVTCDYPWWGHAHNELLQAWLVTGVLGLLAAASVFSGLGWLAVRYSHRDQRTLLSLVVCSAVLLGFEVITSGAMNWIGLGLAAFIAISSRSVQMMTAKDLDRVTSRTGAMTNAAPSPGLSDVQPRS